MRSNASAICSRVEEYAKKRYDDDPEQLPFGYEDYAVLRHANNGEWYAVFIVKPRSDFGLEGDGYAEIMSVKIKDREIADELMRQPGFIRGLPSRTWNWTSMVLDGTVQFERILMLSQKKLPHARKKSSSQLFLYITK